MNGLLEHPGLPKAPVKLALVSGEYSYLARALEKLEINVVQTFADNRLPEPVRFHPDMQACCLDQEQIFVLKGNPLINSLKGWGIEARETAMEPECRYPKDVLCNAFSWGGNLIGNPTGMDPAVLQAASKLGLRLLPVRQGYASCSVALVNERAAITSDPGMATALERYGYEILRIRPGYIRLPGYTTGFIGGCCGKLAPDLMAFSGGVAHHPDGGRILAFLEGLGISVWELSEKILLDVGGIVPLI